MKRLFVFLVLLVGACSTAPGPTLDASLTQPLGIETPVALPRLEPAVVTVKDPRSDVQIALAACTGLDGKNHCPQVKKGLLGAPPSSGPIVPASWTITNWYVDPQNTTTCASDTNSGTAATCTGGCSGSVCTSGIGPIVTFGELIYHRLGTPSPQIPYGQSVTFNLLSPQTAGVDAIFFEPFLSGGGQAIFTGFAALTSPGATFASGNLSGGFGYSGATPTAGGTPMVIAGVPSYVVAKTLLYNSARTSYAFVDSVLSTNATMQQPQTSASTTTTTAIPSPAVDNDWVAGDTITPYTLPLVNMKRWSPVGSDLTSGGQPTSGWVLFTRIYDPSGATTSAYNFFTQSAINVLSIDQIDTRLDFSILGGRSSSSYAIGCTVQGQLLGVIYGFGIYGGGYATGAQLSGAGGETITNNALIHGSVVVSSLALVGNVFADGTWSVFPGGTVDATAIFFGSYNVTVDPGATYWNNTGSTFALKALLTTGTLKLGTATTGSSYNPGTGIWTSAVSITPANIDTNSGLQDPISGARFTDTN
jgi:hypothetical protein